MVYVTRKYKDEDILIQWDCQNEVDPDDLNNPVDYEDVDEGAEEQDVNVNFGIHFEVLITRNGNSLVIDCVAAKELQISNIRYIEGGRKNLDDEDRLYSGFLPYSYSTPVVVFTLTIPQVLNSKI